MPFKKGVPVPGAKLFVKGKSGNPAGHAKGVKNRATVARNWLEVNQTLNNPLTNLKEQLSQEDIMTLSMIKKARDGDVGAYKALLDSAYGAPKQELDATISGQIILNVTNEDIKLGE